MSNLAKIEELRERLASINQESQDLLARTQAEKRDPSEEERTQLARLADDFDRLTDDLKTLERIEEQAERLSGGRGRRTEPAPPAQRQPVAEDDLEGQAQLAARSDRQGRRNGGGGVAEDRVFAQPPGLKNGGFRTLGEMAISIYRAHLKGGGGYLDPRLERLATPSTYASEGTGGEGGYAVPADYRTSIMQKVMGEDSLISRTDQVPVAGNTLTVPKDNGTPWGTSGVRAYWGSEGGLKSQSKPALETMSLRLHKVYALVPVTDELLEDATAMDAFIRRKAAEAIDFAINLAIIQGTGTGQPLGVLNSPATVSVAKETSQVADTLLGRNIAKMWARLYSGCRANAIWSCHQSVETQIAELHFPGRDTTGADVTGWGSHVYIPPGGLSGGRYATLYGRPIIPTEACEELGDKGDIILWDPSKYLTAVKSGVNPKTDVSIHLWFDYDITAFRFVLRMTGAPWWDAPITPRDGNNTLSAYVTLDARA